MEEKGGTASLGSRQGLGFQSSSFLTSVRLQFLAGCFGLGSVGHAGAKGESIRLHHYQVRAVTLRRGCHCADIRLSQHHARLAGDSSLEPALRWVSLTALGFS